jgi:hypothetical protein
MVLAWNALLLDDVLILPKNGFLSTFFIINEFFYASARTKTSVLSWALVRESRLWQFMHEGF